MLTYIDDLVDGFTVGSGRRWSVRVEGEVGRMCKRQEVSTTGSIYLLSLLCANSRSGDVVREPETCGIYYPLMCAVHGSMVPQG